MRALAVDPMNASLPMPYVKMSTFDLAMNDLGQAVVAWTSMDHNVLKSERASDGTWTNPIPLELIGKKLNSFSSLSPAFAVINNSPRVALNNQGEAIVTWTLYNTSDNDGYTFASERKKNNPDGTPGIWNTFVDTDDSLSKNIGGYTVMGVADVALNEQGEAIVTWLAGPDVNDYTTWQSFKAERGATDGSGNLGSWNIPSDGTDFIQSPNGYSQTPPTVAMNNATGSYKKAIILLGGFDASGTVGIYSTERRSNGVWEDTQLSAGLIAAREDFVGAPYSAEAFLTDTAESLVFSRGDRYYYATKKPNIGWYLSSSQFVGVPAFNFNGISPKQAVNKYGEAIVTWLQYDSGISAYRLYKAERNINGTWKFPSSETDWVNTFGTGGLSNDLAYQISLNDEGQALLTWQAIFPGDIRIYAATRNSDGIWSFPSSDNDYLSLATFGGATGGILLSKLNNQGRALVVWTQFDGSKQQIYKAEMDEHGAWTKPVDGTDTISGTNHHGVTTSTLPFAMDLNDQGQAVVAMRIKDTSDVERLLKAERKSDGTWTLPSDSTAEALSNGAKSIDGVHAKLNQSGHSIIAWTQYNSSNKLMGYKIEGTIGGTWSSGSDLSDSLSPDGQHITSLNLHFNDSNEALLTWIQSNGSDYAVFKSEKKLDGSWVKPLDLTDSISFSGGSAGKLQSILSQSGEGLISWIQSDGSSAQAYLAERNSSGQWTLPNTLADSFTQLADPVEYVRLSLSNSGEATVFVYTYTGQYIAQKSAAGSWNKWVGGGALYSDLPDELKPFGFSDSGLACVLNDSGTAAVLSCPSRNQGMVVSEYR